MIEKQVVVETVSFDTDDISARKLTPAQQFTLTLSGETLEVVEQASADRLTAFKKRREDVEFADNFLKSVAANRQLRIENGELCPCGSEWDDCLHHKGKRGKV